MKRALLLVCAYALLLPLLIAQTSVPPELISYPDTILHNGKILTVDASFSTAEAVAIRRDQPPACGAKAWVKAEDQHRSPASGKVSLYSCEGRSPG